MKKLIAILVLVLGTSVVTAQNQGNRYMFTGKLVSAPATIPNCSGSDIATAFEFEIEMFSDGAYTQTNVPIVVICPNDLGAGFFKVDATYKMEVFDDNGGTFTISNQALIDGFNLSNNYFAGDIKRLQ